MNSLSTPLRFGSIAIALLLLTPTRAYAQDAAGPDAFPLSTYAPNTPQTWDDKSDELPGIVDGSTLLIAGAVAAVVALVAVQRNRKKKENDEKDKQRQADGANEQNAHSLLLQPDRPRPLTRLRPAVGGFATPRGVTVGATWRF